MNTLADTLSPYLLQHKDNPVHWQQWNEEVLKMAREKQKPIIVSIGYSTCHWCHVMEHESFEDAATAAVPDQDVIAIAGAARRAAAADSAALGQRRSMSCPRSSPRG